MYVLSIITQLILIAVAFSLIIKSDPEITEYERKFGKMKTVDMSQLDKDNVFLLAGQCNYAIQFFWFNVV